LFFLKTIWMQFDTPVWAVAVLPGLRLWVALLALLVLTSHAALTTPQGSEFLEKER
jgi:hypothetical protein